MPLIKKPSYNGIESFLTDYNIVQYILHNSIDTKKSFNLNTIFRILDKELKLESINSLDMETSLDFLKEKLGVEHKEKRHYLYRLFDFLANEHFNNTKGKIVLNIENIDEFQSLVNSVDMTPIYATAVNNYLSHYSEQDRSSYIKESISNTILSYPARFNFLSMVSDNHFHLGGALHFTYRLDEILKNPFHQKEYRYPSDRKLEEIEKDNSLSLVALMTSVFEKIIFTYMIQKDLDRQQELDIQVDQLFQFLARNILQKNISAIKDFQNYITKLQLDKEKRKNTLEKKQSEEQKNNNEDQGDFTFFHFVSFREKMINSRLLNQKTFHNMLIAEIYRAHHKGELQKSDKLFWILLVDYLQKGINKTIIDYIYMYTILRNVIRRYIVQQHVKEGLNYFSSVSKSDIRRAKIRREYLDSFRSIFLKNFNINIEGRINFQDSAEDFAMEMHNWLESFLIVEYENTQQNYKENQLSFILHFQKKPDTENKRNEKTHFVCRYGKYRDDLFQKTEQFFKFFRSPKYKRYKIPLLTAENLQRLKRKFYDLECLEQKERLSDYEKDKLERLKHLNLHKHLFINKKYCENGFIRAVEVNLTRYISGIDAASKEHTTPPEVFAPVFNYIRSSMEISRISFDNRTHVENYDDTPKHFQFTFHAGEDFRDIISGMRSVVEAVLFLGLRKGDRIGHALALGLKHRQWARKKRRIFTSIEEQFDNAVFAYIVLTLFSDRWELKKHFYQKALQFGNRIYQKEFTIDNYINAWLLRRNCPVNLKRFLNRFDARDREEGTVKHNFSKLGIEGLEQVLEIIENKMNAKSGIDTYYQNIAKRCSKTSVNTSDEEYKIKDFRQLTRSRLYFEKSLPDIFKYPETYQDEFSKRYEWAQTDVSAWEIYIRYQYDQKVKERGREKIDEPMRTTEYTEVLQDLILENIIAKRDIIIEAMPSSNVLNSYIEDYHNHPIFRFKPVDSLDEFNKYGIRKNPVRVIINTDNPGFQATSYINELFLIHNAGLKLGYSAEKVEQYIKEIVELGNSIFENRASQE